MSWLAPKVSRQAPAPDMYSIIRAMSPRWGAAPTPMQAMRNSVLFACLDLRASLVSTLPIHQVHHINGGLERMTTLAPLWKSPGSLTLGGPLARRDEWLYASQIDLDRFGNCFGMIVQRDAMQRPLRIDLTSAERWTVTVDRQTNQTVYKLDGKAVDTQDVWHERSHVIAGSPVGMDPIGMAAMALETHQSAAEFAAAWFGGSGIAGSVLQNTKMQLNPVQADILKDRVRGTLSNGDVLVLGNDYTYSMVSVPPNQTAFLELMAASAMDVARFIGVPGDLVDVHQSGASITYANITQRNLQFLIMHLGPAVARREAAMSAAIATPWEIELDTDGLLRMDPIQQATVNKLKVDSRSLHPDEWREQDNRPPLTAEQMASFELLFARTTQKIDAADPIQVQPTETLPQVTGENDGNTDSGA